MCDMALLIRNSVNLNKLFFPRLQVSICRVGRITNRHNHSVKMYVKVAYSL